MLLLRDHYKAAVDEKVGALLLLPDPIWRPNFTVALSWAQRHFGQRLRPETVSALRSRLREVLDVPVPLVQLFPQPAPGAVLPRFTLPAGPPPPAPGLRSPGPGPEALDVGVGPAERRSPARLPSPTFSLAFSSSPSSPPLCPPIPPASSSSPVPLTPSPPRPAAPGPLQSTTPLAQMTRLASSRLRRRVAAMPAPGPSSSPLPPPPPPPPPSGSTPPHGLARADPERNDAPADARDPASPASSFSTPTVTLARPTRHPSTGKKCQEWHLQSREPLLILVTRTSHASLNLAYLVSRSMVILARRSVMPPR